MQFALGLAVALALPSLSAEQPSIVNFEIRGRAQPLRDYGDRNGTPVVVASGDGGWTHLGPDVAQFLAGRGYRVLGLDSKAYLSSFTTKAGTLATSDVPGDFAALLSHAGAGAERRALLVGVSEGAALGLLAAAADAVKPTLLGVIALGLPEKAELGWRFRDSIIYLNKGLPDEPLFDTAEFAPLVAPIPLVAIHATHDEFTSVERLKAVMDRAREPKRLRLLDARDHRFSDNQEGLQKELVAAISWIQAQ